MPVREITSEDLALRAVVASHVKDASQITVAIPQARDPHMAQVKVTVTDPKLNAHVKDALEKVTGNQAFFEKNPDIRSETKETFAGNIQEFTVSTAFSNVNVDAIRASTPGAVAAEDRGASSAVGAA